MIRNYLTTAWRNLKRHKAFSAINILGLAIGIAACLLILQYVTFQFSFDAFHENKDQLYRMVLGETVAGRHITPPALGPALKTFPQVKQVARLREGSGVFTYENAVFLEEDIYFADASFLTMFSYPLLKGNPATALTQPNTTVISQSAARKYFGRADPVGKVINMSNSEDGTYTLQVTGVLQDLPQYSHLQFDMLLSYATLQGEQYNNAWNWRNFTTYVLLDAKADPSLVEANLPGVVKKAVEENNEYQSFWLQPLRDIHVSSEVKEEGSTDPNMIYFLLLLSLFILVIAWINYINLSTARAVERAKEVGVRKAIGASRYQLLKQFLFESVILNAIGMVIAFTFVQLSLPYFRQLTGLNLSLTLWNDPYFWIGLITLFLVGTILSGIYPALVLSSFKPIMVLKGKVQTKTGGLSLRKSLVVFQFAASVALMAGTFTVYTQMEYMRNQDLGMNIDQTLVVKGPQLMGDSASSAKQWNVFKTEMQKVPLVRSVTASDAIPSEDFDSYYGNVAIEGIQQEEKQAKGIMCAGLNVDADFIDSYGIPLMAGRAFSEELATDAQTAIINEELLKMLGFAEPGQVIGKTLRMSGRRLTVIGVVKNYHHQYLKNGYFPTAFLLDPTRTEYFSLKINTGTNPTAGLKKALTQIESSWQQIYPGNPFDSFFLDDVFNEQYEADNRLGSTIALFAFLAVLVACLGLFGLASFTTSQRKKEIGVRKVLGASIADIARLLNKDFIKLVLIANLIAWPLTYWGISKWLENYAFPIDINLWLFLLPSLLVLLIAVATVSFQTLKAARTNPVDSLRNE